MQIITLSEVLEKFDGDFDFYIDILVIYLSETRNCLTEIKNCLNNKNLEDLRRLVHTIKGGSNNVGATYVAQTAKEIEDRIINQDYNIMEHVLNLESKYMNFYEYASNLIDNQTQIKSELEKWTTK